MVLDLKKLFRGDGVEESAACELDFSGVELGGAKPFCAPVKELCGISRFPRASSLYSLHAL